MSGKSTKRMSGEEFAAIRRSLGLTQAELGRIMGMRFQSISRIETATGPTKIQEAFIRYIFCDDGYRRPRGGDSR